MSDEKQFDIVNKAAHYNSHPSGVECVELAERLPFNTGNAFKYVFRRGDKGNTVQDLEKAIYYLNRERSHLENIIRYVPERELPEILVNRQFTLTDLANIRKLKDHEPNASACAIYSRIFRDSEKILRYIEGLGYAAEYVQRLIQEITSPVSKPVPEPNVSMATAVFPGTVHPDWKKG